MSMHFNAQRAVTYGVNEAIIIEHLINTGHQCNDAPGVSSKEIRKVFPFWTKHQIRRMLKRLVAEEVLTASIDNDHQMDRTTKYKLNPWSLL